MNNTEALVKCRCQHCNNPIAFSPEQFTAQGASEAGPLGPTVTCPHCGMDTVVFIPRPKPPEPPKQSPPLDYRSRYCARCGTIGVPVAHTSGSFFMEVFLWLLMVLPGIIYSIWRLTTRAQVCPKCGSTEIIPIDSPRAQQMFCP
jgi:hypothetical protein